MKELGIDYVRYIDKCSDKKMHGSCKGFFNDIAERRRKKIQAIGNRNSLKKK